MTEQQMKKIFNSYFEELETEANKYLVAPEIDKDFVWNIWLAGYEVGWDEGYEQGGGLDR